MYFSSNRITLADVKFRGGDAIKFDICVDRENFDADKWRVDSLQGYVIPKWSPVIRHAISVSANQTHLQNYSIYH